MGRVAEFFLTNFEVLLKVFSNFTNALCPIKDSYKQQHFGQYNGQHYSQALHEDKR